MMKATKKLLPGRPGTVKWTEKYGDSLVCVRYRDDDRRNQRLTTVELIVSSRPLKPKKSLIPMNKIVLLRIEYNEDHLRRLVKGAGGKWNREKQAWELPYGQVRSLGLENRMVMKNGQY
jgi:hypothetical protein